MRRQAILSLFLLTILMGQAVAIPIVVPLAIGGVAGGALGFLIGKYVPLPFDHPKSSNNYELDYINYKIALINNAKKHGYVMATYKNLAEYVKYYALARAKAVYAIELAKGLNNTTDMYSLTANASNKAISVAEETINNATTNFINYWNSYIEGLSGLLYDYISVANNLGKPTYLSPEISETEVTSVCTDEFHLGDDIFYYECFAIDGPLYLNETELYNKTEFTEILHTLNDSKCYVHDNLVAYFDQLNSKIINGEIDVRDVINGVMDPYTLITLAQNDSANRLAWALYSLALMGLLTNITGSVTVKIGNKTYDGYLFTSYPATFKVGHNYTIPEGKAAFILTPDGLIALKPGDQFELLRAIDEMTGNELPSLMMKGFTPASFNATQYDEELKKLIELQKEILDKLTNTGGGGGGLTDWWNSLDTTTRLLIIGGGIVALVVLVKSRGGGGISLIRVESSETRTKR